jgi:hypothetical protein
MTISMRTCSMTTNSDPKPDPNAPGYGDQGPAGGGREPSGNDEAAETEDEPGPIDDLGG